MIVDVFEVLDVIRMVDVNDECEQWWMWKC